MRWPVLDIGFFVTNVTRVPKTGYRMATIWKCGPFQFCARIQRKGVSETETFETRREAEDWARVIEGKVTGDEFVDLSETRNTTLSTVLEWYEKTIVPEKPRSATGNLSALPTDLAFRKNKPSSCAQCDRRTRSHRPDLQ